MYKKLSRKLLIGLFAVILVVCGVLGFIFSLPQDKFAKAEAPTNEKKSAVVEDTGNDSIFGNGLDSSLLLTSASTPTVSDTTPPTLSLTKYSTGGSVANGGISNERVSVRMSDAHPNLIYYKTPSMSSFLSTSINPYVLGTENGTYSVYATDTYGNKSSTYTFIFDDTRPVGNLYCNGISVSSGSYVSDSFCFAATDATSGIQQLYYKTPVSGAYQPYVANTTILSNTGDGWYYFYAVDNAGNASSTFSIFLEAKAPTVNIYRNNSLVYSKSITVTENVDTDIYFKLNDKLKITYSSSSGHVSSDYTLNSNYTISSSYTETSYYISITTAIGKHVNFKYHVVQTEPYIIVDGTTYKNGASLRFSSDKTITFMDDPSIQSSLDTGAKFVSEGNVNLTEFITYTNASTKKLTTAQGTETKYTITLNDRAGNQSNFVIVIDKKAPVGDWMANGSKLSDNSYSASSLSFVFTESGVTAKYSLNGGSYISYSSGTLLTAEGTYRMLLTDSVGNQNQYTAYIDKSAPSGLLYSNGSSITSGSYTNKSFYYTASDSRSGIDSLYYRTPTSSTYKTYQDGTVISANSENGWYYFYARDKVGNQSSTVSVYLDSTKPTLAMKGYSTGSSISNGAAVGERVTITASDTNFYRLYYKTPGNSTYTATSASSYTTGTTNGWYYVYAVDTVGNSSDTYSILYDSTAPSGSLKANGASISSGAYINTSFSYSATDSGSGVKAVYYKTPQSSVYQIYSAGSIIPTSAGDGWYYFYAVDACGNTSTTMSVYLDTTKPTLTMKGNSSGNVVQNGSATSELVTIIASDTNFSRLYYKTPGSSSYTSTTSTSYTTGTTNGWYYVYAVDTLGNTSDTYSLLYDSTAPVGKIYSNGAVISSGAYISKSFSYSATDSGSGVATLYCKTPVSGTYISYTAGTIIPSNSGDGWYYFYAVDNVGLQSAVSSVYLETEAPLVEIYRNGDLAYSKTVTGAGTFDTDIYLCPNDTLRISCDTSSGKVTSNYELDKDIVIGSSYSANEYNITLTSATGITTNFTYHIVRNKPTVLIDGKTYSDGETAYFNADKTVKFVCDSVIKTLGDTGVTISSEGNVNINELITFASGKDKTLTTSSNTETKYILQLVDRAGNECTITLFIDKLAAEGEWMSNDMILQNGGYTNKPLSFEFAEPGVSATYSYNGSEYAKYTSGQIFTADGTYIVVLTDLANNKSSFTAHIDTIAPTGTLYANYKRVESGAITNGSVYFTWDGDITATINGEPYTKNTVITDDGIYKFVLTDFAGNSSEYYIEIDTVKASDNMNRLAGDKSYTVAKWYVVDFEGETKAFATYESALEYACEREFGKYVTLLELSDVKDFTQFHLIASRGNAADEVREGTYWRYKSQANAKSELYYFDRELLAEVVSFYAQNYVSGVNYFTLDGDVEYGELADNMYDNIWSANDGTKAPCVNGFTFEKTDSVAIYAMLVGSGESKVAFDFGVPFDNQFSLTGLYEITEVDGANNINVYYVFLDNSAPTLKVSAEVFGENNTRELTITEETASRFNTYYYKTFEVKQLLDNDTWVTLMIESETQTKYFSYGDKLPILNVGGEYLVTVYDRLGNTYSFTVYIVGNEAAVTFKPNSDATAFEVSIVLEQKFDTLVTLEIYRDGKLISGISTDVFNYTFDKAGYYTVTMRDNFGRIITRNFQFDKSLPTGTLEGVENGEMVAGKVGFTYDKSKYYAVVSKDGASYATDKTGVIEISADGKYEIKLINLNDDENFNIYTFEIDTAAPVVQLKGGENGKTTNSDVIVSWQDTDVKLAIYTLNGGELTVFENETKFTAEGKYILSVVDDLGNETTVIFTIDKTLDYIVYINDAEVTGVDTTNKNIQLINNEDLHIVATKDGEEFEYEFGQLLIDEGTYSFRIFDDFGNTTLLKLVIDKSVDFTASTGNGVITNDDVIIEASEKVNVFVTKDGIEYEYTLGTEISEEGTYRVIIYDAFGNEATMSFQIVRGTKTKLNYALGENVDILSVVRDGNVVDVEGKNLNFNTDGTYTVICMVDGKEYSFSLTLDTTAPTIELNGVSNGGTSGKSVSIDSISEEAELKVYKDGELIEYELGQKLSDYGSYRVVVTDSVGNTNEYSFTLKYKMDGGIIALIVICALAAVGGGVFLFIRKRRRS